jgi:hypothetical protein
MQLVPSFEENIVCDVFHTYAKMNKKKEDQFSCTAAHSAQNELPNLAVVLSLATPLIGYITYFLR